MPFLTVRRHRLYYEWRGDFDPTRETAVFLHDGLGATGSWRDVPERIGRATGLNALVYDRYGYGRSAPRANFPFAFMNREAPALGELLGRLGLESAHLVGHSDGGSIALLFAAQHPERVRSVVTEAAHTMVEDETRHGIQELMDALAAGKLPPWLFKLHGERGEAVLRAWGRSALSARHKEWNILASLAAIQAPLFVIQGEHDEFGTEAQVESISSRAGDVKTWLVKGCGHTPHGQETEAFVRRVAAFLRRHKGLHRGEGRGKR